MQNTTTRKTFEEIMQEYKNLESDSFRQMIRNIAAMSLKESGFQEIGSSDVNCEIVGLYNSYEGFDGIVRHGLDLVRSH